MLYKTQLSGEVRVWHPALNVKQIEALVGASATIKREADDPKKEAYCTFEIAARRTADIGAVVRRCVKAAKKLSAQIHAEPRVGARIWIVITFTESSSEGCTGAQSSRSRRCTVST